MRVRLLLPPRQFRFARFFRLSETVLENLLEAALCEAAKMLLAMIAATNRMKRIANGQGYLGAIRVERDAAQLFDRLRGSNRLAQAKTVEDRVGPFKEPLAALRFSLRVSVGALVVGADRHHVGLGHRTPRRVKLRATRVTTYDRRFAGPDQRQALPSAFTF